jgi:hypothetical protein
MTEILEPESSEVAESSPGIANALRAGAAGGAQAARNLLSMMGRGASTTAYGGAYYLAYGVTFGAMFVGHFIPRDSAFSRGLHEGTDKAVGAFHAWEEPATVPEQAVTEAEVVASEEPARRTKRRSTPKETVTETLAEEPVPAT